MYNEFLAPGRARGRVSQSVRGFGSQMGGRLRDEAAPDV
jgi:hypothetical protein